jgi:hypothetical protein
VGFIFGGLALFSVDSWLILINYYATWVMLIHPLVVNSSNKSLQRLKANAVELANLRAS